MTVLLYILSIILSWLVGSTGFSLAQTIAERTEKDRKINNEHFVCDFCDTRLKIYELIPVLSFIFSKGRCRYCGEKISRRVFLNEIIGGFAGLLVFFRFGDDAFLSSTFTLSSLLDIVIHFDIRKLFVLIIIMLFLCILDLIFIIDYDTMEIPNRFVIAMLIISIASVFVVPGISIIEHIIGAVSISVPMFLLTLLIPGAFGGGDVKMLFAAGLMLGWKLTIVSFIISLIFAGIYGIIVLATKKKSKKEHFPFGPYLCVGFLFALICGNDIINAYMKLATFLRG